MMKTISFFCWFFLLSMPLVCAPETTAELSVKVISVADGDSFTAMADGKKIKVRIHGIDAPEKAMPFYKVAKQKLSSLIGDKTIRLDVVETDQYGRKVAKATTPDGKDVASEMIGSGLAWHYKHYSNDPKLAALEKAARQKRIGLWQEENPSRPWEVRKIRRQK